jgi:hypothetical protein
VARETLARLHREETDEETKWVLSLTFFLERRGELLGPTNKFAKVSFGPDSKGGLPSQELSPIDKWQSSAR